MQSLIQFLRHDMNVSLNTMLYSPHCSPIFPSVFGREESTMCNKLLLQFGGCTTHFGSFCVYSSVYVLGSLLLLWKVENHPSRKKKAHSPLWVLCEDTSIFCDQCSWSCRIFMSWTHPVLCDCRLPVDSKGKNWKDAQYDYRFWLFFFLSPLNLSYK